MFNFYNKNSKSRKIMVWVIVILLCICMVLPTAFYLVSTIISAVGK